MGKRKTSEQEKDKILWTVMVIGIILIIGVFVENVRADQIVHKFKSPSFNGVGTSSHYLTIENQEFSRKLTIKEEINLRLSILLKKGISRN